MQDAAIDLLFLAAVPVGGSHTNIPSNRPSPIISFIQMIPKRVSQNYNDERTIGLQCIINLLLRRHITASIGSSLIIMCRKRSNSLLFGLTRQLSAKVVCDASIGTLTGGRIFLEVRSVVLTFIKHAV
jgi:hypothetical protein